jgi:phenylalanyl-tRNA synthetase alpha chain
MLERIRALREAFDAALPAATDADAIEALRIRFLARKGEVTAILRGLGQVAAEERKEVGKAANALRQRVQSGLEQALARIEAGPAEERHADITLPGRRPWRGGLHPLRQTELHLVEIFQTMGFDLAYGPDVELDDYNFKSLNFPDDHPARDLHDTFYIEQDVLLRTHTSPVQVRTMERLAPPVRVITPGRVYRCETIDASHAAVFHQLEGLYVDERVSMADLKGTLAAFARALFGTRVNVRFRPDFFPFTEPSVEFAFSCAFCGGSGCRVCKNSGWIEIGGAGMVDPEVFKAVQYDPERFTGFAFGLGIERIAMLLYEIPDIRLFFENDLRLLEATW